MTLDLDKVFPWLRDWITIHGEHGRDGEYIGHYGPLGTLDAVTCPCGDQIRGPYATAHTPDRNQSHTNSESEK